MGPLILSLDDPGGDRTPGLRIKSQTLESPFDGR
jgi:hypothetical protein